MFAHSGARRAAAIVFAGACIWLYYTQNISSALPTPGPSDFSNLYRAAAHVLHGESPFQEFYFIYPPLSAIALAPLAHFDYFTARWIWFLMAHACFLGAAWLWWRRLGGDGLAAAVVALVWSGGWVAWDGFITGQPDALILFLVVAACAGPGWIPGAAAGVGLAVKLIPGVLGLLPVLQRNWRGVAAFAASAAILMALPWAMVAGLRGPSRPGNTDYVFGTPAALSWSFPSAALRMIEPPGPSGKLPDDWLNGWDLPRLHLSAKQKVVSLTVAAVILAAGVAVLLIRTRARLDAEQVPVAGAALIALALAASPIAWWHYQVLQYPGMTLLLCYSLRARDWRRVTASVVCCLLVYVIPTAVMRYYYSLHNQWPESAGFVYFWTAVTPVASLGLFGLLVSYLTSAIRVDRRATPPASR